MKFNFRKGLEIFWIALMAILFLSILNYANSVNTFSKIMASEANNATVEQTIIDISVINGLSTALLVREVGFIVLMAGFWFYLNVIKLKKEERDG